MNYLKILTSLIFIFLSTIVFSQNIFKVQTKTLEVMGKNIIFEKVLENSFDVELSSKRYENDIFYFTFKFYKAGEYNFIFLDQNLEEGKLDTIKKTIIIDDNENKTVVKKEINIEPIVEVEEKLFDNSLILTDFDKNILGDDLNSFLTENSSIELTLDLIYYKIANYLVEKNNLKSYKLAINYYNKIIDDYPSSSFFKNAVEKKNYILKNFLIIR